MSSGVDIDALLRRMDSDLRRLPRHEWDGYLWRLCSQLVGAPRAHADADNVAEPPRDEPPIGL